MKSIYKIAIAILFIAFACVTYAKDSYTIAVSCPGSFCHSAKQYKPLQQWLAKKTHKKIHLVAYAHPETAINNLINGKFDVAYIKVYPYLLAQEKDKSVRPLVTAVTWNHNGEKKLLTYNSYIVTLKVNKKINGLSDLKNKTLAFSNPYSMSGFVYPTAVMKLKGINYKTYFKNTIFMTHHKRILDALLNHEADAGVMWDYAFTSSKDRNQFKIINVTPNIPNPLFAASSHLKKKDFKRLQKAFESFDTKNLTTFPYFAGFAKTPKHFYRHINSLPHFKK